MLKWQKVNIKFNRIRIRMTLYNMWLLIPINFKNKDKTLQYK